MLATEVSVASAIVLLANVLRIAWSYWHKVAVSRRAELVHARHPGNSRFGRWRERAMIRRLPPVRDAIIVSPTGCDVLADPDSLLREVVETAREIRVILMNPVGDGLAECTGCLLPEATEQSLYREIAQSIGRLSDLRKRGRAVALKFCEREPFWKVTVLGDHAWVQHCRSGLEAKEPMGYVFAREQRDLRQGLYLPFYSYALNEWSDPRHAQYDFDRDEIVFRDAAGTELRRVQLGAPRAERAAA
jgi:hypothetical protein